MRFLMVGSLALLLGMMAGEAMAAQKASRSRTVQVIAMGVPPAPSSGGDQAPRGDAEPVGNMPAAPLPEAFRTHDLSRRWVAFEMANSFAASAASPSQQDVGDADPFAKVGLARLAVTQPGADLAPAPVIAIPAWMRDGGRFSSAPTSFAPGCSPASYRPAGFLSAAAEIRRSGYYGMMSGIACEYGIPVGLFDALIIRESKYKADAFSEKNAFGLTQLMPDTAVGLGVNRYDVEQNLRGGARYLRQQLDNFGQVHLALAAYNAGPGRVRNGLVPRIAQTQDYVDNVLLNWQRLAGMTPVAPVRTAALPGSRATRSVGRTATVFSY